MHESHNPTQAAGKAVRRGYTAMPRGWRESFDRFQDAAAYHWMVEKAVWQGSIAKLHVNGRDREISLQRGQLCGGTRYLASQYGWSQSAVRCYLAKLERKGMIKTSADQGLTVITVCKYDELQSGEWPFERLADLDNPELRPHSTQDSTPNRTHPKVVSLCETREKRQAPEPNSTHNSTPNGNTSTSSNQLNHEDLHCSAASPPSSMQEEKIGPERGGEAAADPSVLPEPMRLKQRKLMPKVNEPPSKWFGVVTNERRDEAGTERPVCGGWFIDGVALRVHVAAGMGTLRLDLWTLAAWLRDGHTPDQIIGAIESHKERRGKGYRAPHSLCAFDDDVRALQPARREKAQPEDRMPVPAWMVEDGLPETIQQRDVRIMPTVNDSPEEWARTVTGGTVPVYRGHRIDELAARIFAAGRFVGFGKRGDWWRLLAWLRDGFDEQHIISAIVARGPQGSPPSFLGQMDNAVRSFGGISRH